MISLDFQNEVIKAAPVAGVAAADGVSHAVFGLSMNEWFYAAAIVYTLAQTFVLIYKAIKGGKKDV